MSDPPAGLREDQDSDERLFRLLVDGVIDYAIFLLDANGLVATWNRGAERIKGYKASEIIGRPYEQFFTQEDRELGLPSFNLERAERMGRFEAEGWRVRKDGSRFLAHVVIDAIRDGDRLRGFAKITRDITERRRTETALAASEDQLKLLVSGVTDYALYMLDPTGYVTNWNVGGERIKGYSASEIIGEHFSRFYTDSDRRAGKPLRALKIAEQTGKYEEEGWRVRKDGTFFWASVVLQPIRAADGGLIGYAKITRDITERRDAQQKLENLQRQLAESQKLDALGQLTGGVAHDFNNLLMVLAGNVPALERLARGDARAERAVQAIEMVTQRGSALTNQLLSFARRQRVNPKVIQISESLRSVRDVLQAGLGSAYRLQTDIAPRLWAIKVDPSELETALVNLVVNARDAMAQGGVVRISARNVADEDGEEFVAIDVTDRGVGIPPDVIAKVFDPFFTTKQPGKGTGLGLSQVHGFAHQAGGTVRIESSLGQGTTVSILLPRAALPEATELERQGAAPQQGGSVLLVEDNPDVAYATTALLEQLGYEVSWAADGESGLREFSRGRFDFVLSDIVMPGRIDGIALAREIRGRSPKTPVLLATGYSQSHGEDTGFEVLRKPFQIHDLSQAIGRLRQQGGALP